MKKDKNIKYIDFNAPQPASAGTSRSPSNSYPPVKNGGGGNGGRNGNGGKKPPGKGKLTLSQKTKSILAVVGTTLLTIFLIAVITVCIVAVALTVYIMQFAENSFDIDLKAAEMNFTSLIVAYCPDEEDYVELKRLSGDENRFWVDYDDIPQHLVDAIIANEDHRYFEHEGVDWHRTTGVVIQAFFSGGDDRLQGGSTITQQLVKNVTGDDKVNVGRKLREIFRALSLEQKYTKLDILEAYLNRIGFGGTSCGVGSAAWYYFDKNVQDITIAEAALMAGVIPSPHFYNPYINAERARAQQEIVLGHMHYYGFITTTEYEQAMREKVRFRRPIRGDHFGYVDERYYEWFGLQGDGTDDDDLYFENVSWNDLRTELPYRWSGDYEVTQNWYVDAAIWQVAKDLAEMRGVSEVRAMEFIRSGGLTIYLNMDMKMQETLEEHFRDVDNFVTKYDPTADVNDVIQGAFVIMDYHGRVRALAGGIGEKPGDNCFNRATQAVRPIGSTVKPLSVYGPAIDMNILTYSTFTRD
ncbi:MAG: penicillin-binding protein, partial [Oscillospiraceae bacterium]|nr:penicillin-binding protein [Oscillospiraceae bacterium]